MMFRRLLLLLLVFLVASPLIAQTGNVYVGYSFLSNDLHIDRFLGESAAYTSNGRGNLNGWNASAEIKAIRWIGLVADFSGTYGSDPINAFVELGSAPKDASTRVYTYLFGPRVSLQIGRVRPFAEAMVGAETQGVSFLQLDSHNDSNLATAYGGGFDYRIKGPLAWRVEADYISARLFKRDQSSGSAPVQRNVRFSTGLVFRF